MASNYIWDFLNDKRNLEHRQSSLELVRYNTAIVIGVGGIGSWVALDLALSGQIASLYLYDFDNLEESNLNRTPFKFTQIGLPKVEAMNQLILERRPSEKVHAYNKKFEKTDAEMHNSKYISSLEKIIVFDCRDDTFDDIKVLDKQIKVWKLGYDGLELTIDGNPRNTKVWGTSDGYTVTPSFVCPSQLIANIVVNHSLVANYDICTRKKPKAETTRNSVSFEESFTFDSSTLLMDIFHLTKLMTQVDKTQKVNK